MKKFFILFLALTFVFSMAAVVFAEHGSAGNADNGAFGITGDMRVRGIWQNNYNMNDTNTGEANNADDRWWEQRLRLKITGFVGNGIEVRTRLNVGSNAWGSQDSVHNRAVVVDYAYLHIPVGPVVVDAGNMTRNWGNKLLLWDTEYDTFQVTTNVGDVQLGAYTDKTTDTRAAGGGASGNAADSADNNLADDDTYGIFAIFNADKVTAGLRVAKEDSAVANATNVHGTTISAYFTTSLGAISLAGEIAQKRGPLYDEADGDHQMAGFLYAATDVGAVNVNVFASVLRSGFVADDDLVPSVFLGTSEPTAAWDVQADANSTTKCIAIGAGTDLTSDLSVKAKYLWADLENLASELSGVANTDTGDEEIHEIDLGLAYKLADNATFNIDFGYLMPKNITASDDHAMALLQKVQVFF